LKKIFKWRRSSSPHEQQGRASRRDEKKLPEISIRVNAIDWSSSIEILDSYAVDQSKIYITADGRYLVEDPQLSPSDGEKLKAAATKIVYMLPAMPSMEEEEFLKLLEELGISDEKLAYLLEREVRGYGVLDPIMKDPHVEDIQVPSPGVPAKVVHTDFGVLVTNIVFMEEELDNYVEKLVHKCGKAVSLYNPFMSLRLPEGHRLTVTYRREVSCRGSSLTIRKFPEKPWSITRLMLKGTISPSMAAWLMLLIEFKKALLVVGGVGTGKTSLINALCNLIPERCTIVTIEDTAELRLAHSTWIPLVTREPVTLDQRGEITMFKLVKHALRMSPDYIVVGEVRGEEGRIWAQAMLTGHGGITSFHSESPRAAIERLTADPIKVDKGCLTALHGLVFMKKVQLGGSERKWARRALGIYDLEYNPSLDKARFYKLFTYNFEEDFQVPADVEVFVKTPSAQLIMEESGWDEDRLIKELSLREKFLKRLKALSQREPEYLEYQKVAHAIWQFYEKAPSLRIEGKSFFETGEKISPLLAMP